ncbi:MAG: hypothetical protein EGQ96_01375, partial [Prevotella sp.]|nr:hypothetical protein [Prevotella sp.]
GNALGTMFPFPTPCKGKSKSQPFAHTFALTGRRRLCIDTQGVALGYELTALSGRGYNGNCGCIIHCHAGLIFQPFNQKSIH